MTYYTLPSNLIPTTSTLRWVDNSARFDSALSGVIRTVNRPGGRWRLTYTYTNKTPAFCQELEAFLFRLDGSTHRAVLPDFAYRRQATGTGTPLVQGSGQTGRTLLMRGWNAGETVFKAGDRFSVNNQMLVVAEDCVTSGGDLYLRDEDGNILYTEGSPQTPILIESGRAQVVLTHTLRDGITDGQAIEYRKPVARYLLAESFDIGSIPGVFKSLTVDFDEDVNA